MFIIDYNDLRYSYTGQNVLTKKFNFRLIKSYLALFFFFYYVKHH